MGVRRVNSNGRWESRRIVCVGVDPIPHHGTRCRVSIVRDEYPSRARRRPQSGGIGRSPLDHRDGAAAAVWTVDGWTVGAGVGQIGGIGWPNRDEVTATRLAGGRRKLRAVRLEIGLIAAPVLRPPDAK